MILQDLYKGEISKSGTPILPSKRARKTPEKIQVSKEDLDELKSSSEPNVETDNEQTTESEECRFIRRIIRCRKKI